jgi:hypothetical protein
MLVFSQLGICADGIVYDVAYKAVLDRAQALGYAIPSMNQRIKQNLIVTQLRASGDWTNLDVFYVFANNGSKEFGRINWKSPTAAAASESSSPVWTSNQGWSSNGVGYINTAYNPTTFGGGFAQNSASVGAYFHTGANVSGVTSVIYAISDTIYLYDDPGLTNRFVSRMNSSNATSPLFGTPTNVASNSMYSAARTGSAAITCYVNGSSDSTPASTSVAVANSTLQFLAVGAGVNLAPAGWILAMGFAGNGSVNHSNLYTYFNTYLSNPN